MASFELHRTRRGKVGVGPAIAPVVALFAALIAARAVFAQGPSDQAAVGALLRTAEQATEIPARADVDSVGPDGPVMTAALRLEADGAHDLAVAVIDEALQVIRATHGLYSLEQAPWLQRMISNEEARGNAARAWDVEHELLDLVRRHPGDVRVVPILRDVAAKREDILARYIGGGFPEQIILGCYYSPRWGRSRGSNCRSGSRGVVVRALLSEFRRYYNDAVGIILNQGLEYLDELREIDRSLVRTSYRYRHYLGSYEVGRQSLVRLAAIDRMNSEPSLTRMKSLIELVDWDLLFVDGATRRSRAERSDALVERYERAHERLEREGTPQASIDQLFSPALPVVLPTFLPNPLAATEAQRGSSRYIDASFVVTRLGHSDRIEILETTLGATESEMDGLVELIQSSRFRPRATNGQFVDTAPIVVRYHLGP